MLDSCTYSIPHLELSSSPFTGTRDRRRQCGSGSVPTALRLRAAHQERCHRARRLCDTRRAGRTHQKHQAAGGAGRCRRYHVVAHVRAAALRCQIARGLAQFGRGEIAGGCRGLCGGRRAGCERLAHCGGDAARNCWGMSRTVWWSPRRL